MNLSLKRVTLAPTSVLGELYVDSNRFCYTLEPRPDRSTFPCIPAGLYRLTVEPTHNSRLWSPYPDRWLPHIWGVPGRTGIEMHAGNHSSDTEGCVICGFSQQADSVASSRDAVKALVDLLAHTGPYGGAYRIAVAALPA